MLGTIEVICDFGYLSLVFVFQLDQTQMRMWPQTNTLPNIGSILSSPLTKEDLAHNVHRRLEFYSPPYMAQPRPSYTGLPATIDYGTHFTLRISLPTAVSRVSGTLLGYQRYIWFSCDSSLTYGSGLWHPWSTHGSTSRQTRSHIVSRPYLTEYNCTPIGKTFPSRPRFSLCRYWCRCTKLWAQDYYRHRCIASHGSRSHREVSISFPLIH